MSPGPQHPYSQHPRTQSQSGASALSYSPLPVKTMSWRQIPSLALFLCPAATSSVHAAASPGDRASDVQELWVMPGHRELPVPTAPSPTW